MTGRAQPDFIRRESKTFRLAHCLLPAWRDGEIDSTSAPGSIGMAFTGQAAAVVRVADGAARPRPVPPMTIGLGGDTPIAWLETDSPSDVLEITGAPGLRSEMARDMHVESHADLDDVHGWQDPIIQAVATRLRAALRGWIPMSDLEAETLVRAAYAQVLRRHFGGREGIRRTLDARRRQRVVELVLDTAAGVLAILIPLSFSWARIGNLPVLCRTVPRLTVIEIASYFSAGNTTEWLHRPPDGSARCPQCRKLPRFREQPLVLSLLRPVLGEFVEAISDNQAFDST